MSELQEGDLLWEVDPISNMLQPGFVKSMRMHKGRGLYNPHTLSGIIIVDNILALSFTDVLPRSFALQSYLTGPLAVLSWFCSSMGLAPQLNSLVLQALGK